MQEENFKEGDFMSLDGFATCLKLDIQKRLGGRFSIHLDDVVKINGIRLKALIIREDGCNVSPTIYIDSAYSSYRDGTGIGEIENAILNEYERNKVPFMLDTSFFTDWGKVRDKIVFRTVSLEKNRGLLEDVPYQQFLDLAVVFECFLGNDGARIITVLIHDRHLGLWGITEDELRGAAFQNTRRLMGCKMLGMAEAVSEAGCDADMRESEDCGIPMCVLTNDYRLNGAGCILYEGVLKELADRLESDICIIPSSVHEVILTQADGEGYCKGVTGMVREVNATLPPEEILADHAYIFHRATGEITIQEGEKL